MRGFSGYAQERVTLSRGGESLEFILSPLPFGYLDLIGEVMPAPKAALNQSEPDPALTAKWLGRRGMLILAKALGPALESTPPAPNAGRQVWEQYADAVKAEFQAAHLVEGDLQILLDTLAKLNRGLGDLPKA